jgi:hypothetical protein
MADEEDGSSTLCAKSPLVDLVQQIMSQRIQVIASAGLSMII